MLDGKDKLLAAAQAAYKMLTSFEFYNFLMYYAINHPSQYRSKDEVALHRYHPAGTAWWGVEVAMIVPILHLIVCATPAAICHRQAVTLSICDAMLVRDALFGVLPASIVASIIAVVVVASLTLWVMVVTVVVYLPLSLSVVLIVVVGLWAWVVVLPHAVSIACVLAWLSVRCVLCGVHGACVVET